MNCNFSQMITVHCPKPSKLVELVEDWDIQQASSEITGYIGTRVLGDREAADRYVCVVEFGVIDPAVSAAEEFARNNARAETRAIVAAVTKIVDGAIAYHDFDEIYRTDQ